MNMGNTPNMGSNQASENTMNSGRTANSANRRASGHIRNSGKTTNPASSLISGRVMNSGRTTNSASSPATVNTANLVNLTVDQKIMTIDDRGQLFVFCLDHPSGEILLLFAIIRKIRFAFFYEGIFAFYRFVSIVEHAQSTDAQMGNAGHTVGFGVECIFEHFKCRRALF